jgi:transketolase
MIRQCLIWEENKMAATHSMQDAVYDKVSTRVAFGEALLQQVEKNDRIMYIAADTLKSVGGAPMQKKYPKRALNVGIAEQDMTLIGAGMAACGAKVFVATYAVFASMRITEQIRSFVCYPHLDVKIVAGLGGLSGGQEGVTHQGIEDVGVLRAIPGLVIVEAADAASVSAIVEAITEYNGPVYLRLGRDVVPTVFDSDYKFQIGKANIMKPDGKDAALISNGAAVARTVAAEKILRTQGYNVQLIEMPCVKPIDRKAIQDAAKQAEVLVTVEDHTIIGGLGSAVSEVLTDNCPARLVRIGIDDCFTESGDMDELLDKYGLAASCIAKKVVTAIKTK